eukprot:TRINITY_DN1825_c0_g2_i1.p1 TRINITY_DN1825_c0_g2~~TRINITY_DN1825_c0_g2_i1.p1  ORF type:complete len:311 (+),score=112.73 TRINITY_DN1825_c0_g2_i1:104-1036(+)
MQRRPITLSACIRFTVFTAVALGLVFGLCHVLAIPTQVALIAFGLNWAVGAVSVALMSERVFDLTGSVTYLSTTVVSFTSSSASTPILASTSLSTAPISSLRALLVSVCVMVWAARLGSFLFLRIMRDGKDGRFDEIKPNTLRFFNVWTVQVLWCFLTSLSVFVLNAAADGAVNQWTVFDVLGFGLWLIGFVVEVVSDSQKNAFRADKKNHGKFIRSGLWKYSRHPNYCGEITLWTGLFIVGCNLFTGVQWLSVLSPVFVVILLTRVSGVPMLEERADKQWADNADYKAYRDSTPILFPGLSLGATTKRS